MNVQEMLQALRQYKPEPRHFTPCKIMFELGSPVILSVPWLMFDGLIAYALAQDILGPAWHELDFRKPMPIAACLTLPLERRAFGSDFVYAASCSRLEPSSSSTTRIRKRVVTDSLEFLDGAPSRVDTVRGDLKSYDMTMPAVSARTCMFHAVGDPAELNRLCRMVDCLGKKRALGFGRVIGYRVEPEDADRSFFLDPGGPGELVNKPLPVAALPALGLGGIVDKPAAMLAYKPPYWDPAGMAWCICPEGF
nr:hypothetical protein [Candidatus Sigynarchaeum springense]